MRFPSLFRQPKHQQFHIKPRHYDPVSEDIKNRTDRIKAEMKGKQIEEFRESRIEFKRKTKSAPMTSMIQLLIAVFLGAMVLGWLEYGNEVFYYALWIIVPAYLLYRLKSISKRK